MHHLPAHEALVLLQSDPTDGLRDTEAEDRLRRHGENVLPSFERRGMAARLAAQLTHPLVLTLLAAAALTYAFAGALDASVILAVVLANAAVGLLQEERAERALDALARMGVADVTAVRGGQRVRIPASKIVPGDLLPLKAGDRVPADVRLIAVDGLHADESSLTGESAPVAKHEAVLPPETLLADRANMAWSGTLLTSGAGSGIVVATGSDTELGLVHRLLSETAEMQTPLTRRLASFSGTLTVAILMLGAFTFAISLGRGHSVAKALTAAVALAVGAIPEGLPAAVTATLAIGVTRMARRQAIVRRLPAVETLGSTTVICTDKTGTLTQNAMTVGVAIAGGQRYEITGSGYEPEGEILLAGSRVDAAKHPALRACLAAGALCGEGAGVEREDGWHAVGDPTEAALVVAARKAGIDRDRLLQRRPRVETLPFSSEIRLMATVHETPDGREMIAKGATESIVELCTQQLDSDGRRQPLAATQALRIASELGARGMRVLAVAAAPVSASADVEHPRGLTLLGLQAMIDPPRPEAVAAVRACRRAGIAVKMITGDHPATAAAVAEQVGLIDAAAGGDGIAAISGARLAGISDAELDDVAQERQVFARVSAEQKLRLVGALQRGGQIVAMTGDGVNDAPALRRADVGVAMGRGGTEVAREAAEIVLSDDNFATIEAAVEEGRHTYDNLTKFILWTLPTNLGEGMLILAAISAGVTLPVLPIQVLWINMTTAVLLGLTLAFERIEPGVMSRPPRDPRAPLFPRTLLWRMLLVSAVLVCGAFWLFEVEQSGGAEISQARTVAVNVFVAVEMLYLISCRSLHGPARALGVLSNRWLLAGAASMAALQAAFTYMPAMNDIFHSAPPDPLSWLRVLGLATAGWGAVELQKHLHGGRRRRSSPAAAPRRPAAR